MLYSLLTLTDAADFLNPLDIYVLLICGIVHDVDHDGVNNTFHINSRSHLANVYNDLSVLENHHCHFAMTILARKESDMFGGMSEAQLKEARQKMISCILATDMGKHFDVTKKLKVLLQAQSFTKEKAEDRQIFADVLLHAADVGNTTRPYKIAKKWAGFLMEEFGAQGDMEKKLELPVSPLCNRDTLSTPKEIAKSQMDFIDFVIAPMFSVRYLHCYPPFPRANLLLLCPLYSVLLLLLRTGRFRPAGQILIQLRLAADDEHRTDGTRTVDQELVSDPGNDGTSFQSNTRFSALLSFGCDNHALCVRHCLL